MNYFLKIGIGALLPLFFSLMTGCATVQPYALKTTSSYVNANPSIDVTPLAADLDVAAEKISYYMKVTPNVASLGLENVLSTAVKEALLQYGGADVLIAMQYQVKYDVRGEIESVEISGYPARYYNFRPAQESRNVNTESAPSSNGKSVFKHKK